jgi:hypothetical protein
MNLYYQLTKSFHLFQGILVVGQHEENAVVRDEPEQVQSHRVPHQVPRTKKRQGKKQHYFKL